MADNTKIEWADATLNYVNGCSVVSPGCTNCYAMKLAGTRLKHHPSRAGLTVPSKSGPVWTGEVRLNEAALMQALKWKRGRRIFWNAHGDLFHENVPDEAIDRLFAVCALTPQHTHMILTKRSARMREYMQSRVALQGNIGGCAVGLALELGKQVFGGVTTTYPAKAAEARELVIDRVHKILPNVWLGVSVEDQARADERIPDLLATPAAVRFISAEPLLGPVDLNELGVRSECRHENAYVEWDTNALVCRECEEEPLLDWVICGGESGPGARPMHPDWARSLRDQCAAVGVAFHFKQWGEWAPPAAFGATSHGPVTAANGGVGNWMRQYVVCGDDRADRLNAHSFNEHATDLVFQVGKKRAGRLLDGRSHDDFPA